MSKQGEIDYLKNIGPDGRAHAFDKPFSDVNCGQYLIDLGTVISLMPLPPAKVLDFGVGTGWTSVFFSKRGYDVVGQDIAEEMINLANSNKERYGLENLHFVTNDYENLNFPGEFDAAVFYDSLHHAVDEVKAIQSAFDALKPGGVLITVEPGKGHANSQSSQVAIANYGVTEKDMPPSLITSIGKQVGFRDYEIYRRQFGAERIDIEPSIRSIVHRLFGIAKTIAKTSMYMQMSNIVVLRK
ncbi:MAG: class I SAM-dependent methyltransferase [Rhodoferax sp.]|nr:class I SAM-dependent methyltransferase [Rhodoferax sp.]